MSDITMAAEQDAIADSLLGTDQAQTVEDSGAEATEQAQAETAEAPEQQVETAEEQSDDWLPTEQEKVFPDEVLTKYATRYGLDEQSLSNPQIRQLVIDKINTDIFLRTMQQQEQFEQVEEPEPQPEPTQQQPEVSREQYFQNLEQVVRQSTDPQVAQAFHKEFLDVWNLPPQQQPMAFAQVASKYMLNLVNTYLPQMLNAQMSQHVEQAFPGFQGMYASAAMASAWDSVRNSGEQFGKLPSFGSAEFKSLADNVAAKYPALADMASQMRAEGKFHGKAAQRVYQTFAQLALGLKPDPETMRQAVAAGQRNAKRAQTTRSNGSLGSGKSAAASGTSKNSQFQTNSDIFDDETMNMWQREHGRL